MFLTFAATLIIWKAKSGDTDEEDEDDDDGGIREYQGVGVGVAGLKNANDMMTSSNGTIFRVTDLLCGEFTGDRWIPLTKSSDAELWCFIWSTPEQTVE